MKVALLKSNARGVGVIFRLIDACSRYPGYPGHYGHAALLFADGTALSSHTDVGVAILPLEYPDECWDVYDVAGCEGPVRAFAAGELGAEYDFGGVERFIDPFAHEDPDKWFCSEIVTAALQADGYFQGVRPFKVSPNKLGKMLVDAGIYPEGKQQP